MSLEQNIKKLDRNNLEVELVEGWLLLTGEIDRISSNIHLTKVVHEKDESATRTTPLSFNTMLFDKIRSPEFMDEFMKEYYSTMKEDSDKLRAEIKSEIEI